LRNTANNGAFAPTSAGNCTELLSITGSPAAEIIAQPSSGNSLLSVVAQLSLSLGVACAGALLGGFTAEVGNDGVDTVLGAFQLTFVTVGIMAMLAAAIFLQLSPKDGKRVVSREHDIEH